MFPKRIKNVCLVATFTKCTEHISVKAKQSVINIKRVSKFKVLFLLWIWYLEHISFLSFYVLFILISVVFNLNLFRSIVITCFLHFNKLFILGFLYFMDIFVNYKQWVSWPFMANFVKIWKLVVKISKGGKDLKSENF